MFLQVSRPWLGCPCPCLAHARIEEPDRHEVFIIGYDPNEPSVLRTWDTMTESKDSKTEHKVCMEDHEMGGSRDAYVLGTGGEPQAIDQEGNQPDTRHEEGPILPQQLQSHPNECLPKVQS